MAMPMNTHMQKFLPSFRLITSFASPGTPLKEYFLPMFVSLPAALLSSAFYRPRVSLFFCPTGNAAHSLCISPGRGAVRGPGRLAAELER